MFDFSCYPDDPNLRRDYEWVRRCLQNGQTGDWDLSSMKYLCYDSPEDLRSIYLEQDRRDELRDLT